MSQQQSTASAVDGLLWGSRARDWATLQELQCAPVYERSFARLGLTSGMKYLDAGCGSGLALQMASALGADVEGLDASEALLAIARERVPSAALHKGELEKLPFAPASFDVVTGFNSFQYAANPVAALAEAGRVVKPGGTVVVMTWSRPEGMPAAALVAALKSVLPPVPKGGTPPPGPFSLSEESALRGFAALAGLSPTEVFDVDAPWHYANLATGIAALGSTGVAARAREFSGTEAVDRANAAALAPFRQTDASYLVPASFRCLLAHAAA